VTVRVEGLTHELLAPKSVRTQTGWITKGGTPTGKCPATSAAGALDRAVHHNWGGSYSSSIGDLEILSILGESHPFTSKNYWEILVNNVGATTGACGIKLHSGEQLLFAAVPDSPTEYPIALISPTHATRGQTFMVKVVSFNAKGRSKPLAGATVAVNGHSGKTGSSGTVPLTPSHDGTFTITASDAGHIRPAPVTLHVTG
jgi:hypothetical protein